MKGYWMAIYKEMNNMDDIKEYGLRAKAVVEKFSGKILARSDNNITTEGENSVRISLAEFPDFDTAQKCYNSNDYKEARKFLEGSAIREHRIFEGI